MNAIKTQADYAAALVRIDALVGARPDSPEEAELALLADLVDRYEKTFPIDPPDWRHRGDLGDYLSTCRGVIHVGANYGQERDIYASHGLRVAWVEPIPEVHEKLVSNISRLPDQRAIRALITDKHGEECVLHVSSNEGASSSIFDLHMHRDIWPEVSYVREIRVKSTTLPAALADAGLNAADYDALVVDTQGSELLVLRGAESLLTGLTYIQVEAADFESYKNGTTVAQLTQFLSERGFALVRKEPFAAHRDGGQYFELLFNSRGPDRT
jgi:FkbM family methyltransferase